MTIPTAPRTASRRRRGTMAVAAVLAFGAMAWTSAQSAQAATPTPTPTPTAVTDAGPDAASLPEPRFVTVTDTKAPTDAAEPAAATSASDPCGADGRPAVYRTKVVGRGKVWVNANVPYDQTKCHKTAGPWNDRYRTDCSGFISMVWALDRSYTTADFVADRSGKWSTIGWSSLQPGDAVVYRKSGHGHIVLFVGWANSGHTAIKAYEEKGTAYGTVATVRYVSTLKSNGYHPIRYEHIS
jgi:hypothetical protein